MIVQIAIERRSDGRYRASAPHFHGCEAVHEDERTATRTALAAVRQHLAPGSIIGLGRDATIREFEI